MAVVLNATVTAEVNYAYSNEDDVGTPQENEALRNRNTYTTGNGDNQVDVVYRVQVTVTTGSPNSDFDLFGTLVDVFGTTVNMEAVKSILVRNLSTTDGDDIYIGPLAVANPLLGPWIDADGNNRVRAGGSFLIDAPLTGYAVEATGEAFRIQYQGTSGSIDVQVVVLGHRTGSLESSSSSSVWSSASSSSSSVAFSSSSSSSSVRVSSSSSSSSVGVSSSVSSSSPSSSSQSSQAVSSSSSGGSSGSSSSSSSQGSSVSSSLSSSSSASSQG